MEKYFDAFEHKIPIVGDLVLAAPLMHDRRFFRSVILLCAKSEEGALGYVLNKKTSLSVREVLEEKIITDFPLYMGGPVQQNTLHYLHSLPSLAEKSMRIGENLYWGGDFSQLIEVLKTEVLSQQQIKFFAGYSGWKNGQLEEEISAHSWIVKTNPEAEHIFGDREKKLWLEVLRGMGKPYVQLANLPEDPTMN